jgi:trehalose-6-phosphate synthase
MPEEEQERRMQRLREQITDNNIYRWAGMLLSEAGKLVEARQGGQGSKVLHRRHGPRAGVGVLLPTGV